MITLTITELTADEALTVLSAYAPRAKDELPAQTVMPAMPVTPVAPVVPVTAPVAAPVAPPAPPVPVVPVAPPPSYTREQIMVAGAALVDAGKMQDLLNLLSTFGVRAVTELKQEQLGAFATEMRKLGAQI